MIRDRNIDRNSRVVEKSKAISITTALSLTSAVVYSQTPGYRYQLKRVRSFCRTKAGTVTAVVKVGGRTAATITFTAATEVAQTLSTTLANLRGSATEAITIELTTDGSGVLTNAFIILVYRAYPLANEAAVGVPEP